MFTLTDNFVVHMIRRSGIFVRLGRRGNLLAVLRRDVTEGKGRNGGEWRGRKRERKGDVCVRGLGRGAISLF